MEIIPLSREGAWYIIVAALIGYGPYNGLFYLHTKSGRIAVT